MVQRIKGIRYSRVGLTGRSLYVDGITTTYALVHTDVIIDPGFQHWVVADMQMTGSDDLKVGAFYFDAAEMDEPEAVLFRVVFASSTGSHSASVSLHELDGTLITSLSTSNPTPVALSASVSLVDASNTYYVKVAAEAGAQIILGSAELYISGTL